MTIDTLVPMAFFEDCYEFFKVHTQWFQLQKGVVREMNELPAPYIALLRNELENDTKAQRGLDKMGIQGETERLHKFFECNYSKFDGNPDMTSCGKMGKKEFVPCEKRGSCPAEGECCKFPCGLTKRECEVANRISLGQMDAEIRIDLEISQDTLRSHKNNIERKISKTGKISIGVWAVNNLN